MVGGAAAAVELGLWLTRMRPLGALVLAALGLALMHSGKNSHVTFAVGLAVAALAVLSLALARLNVDLVLAIDRWLAPSAALPVLGPALLRVGAAAALAFGLAGGSLALSRFERHRFAATMLASVAGAIAVFALHGYLAGIDTLYSSVSVNSLPLPTAAGLHCVAGGDPLTNRNDARARTARARIRRTTDNQLLTPAPAGRLGHLVATPEH